MLRLSTLCIALTLLALGCGGDASNVEGDDQEQPAEPDSAARAAPPSGKPSSPPDSATAADTVGAPGTWTADNTAQPRSVASAAILREVREGEHDDFDRVVFEFEGNTLPGYELEYVDEPVRQCGSGNEVRLPGDGQLEVRLHPARAHTETGEVTVSDRERALSMPVLQALELTCDFEAYVTWVLGLAAPNKYRVMELQNPTRLVVDVRHS